MIESKNIIFCTIPLIQLVTHWFFDFAQTMKKLKRKLVLNH